MPRRNEVVKQNDSKGRANCCHQDVLAMRQNNHVVCCVSVLVGLEMRRRNEVVKQKGRANCCRRDALAMRQNNHFVCCVSVLVKKAND